MAADSLDPSESFESDRAVHQPGYQWYRVTLLTPATLIGIAVTP